MSEAAFRDQIQKQKEAQPHAKPKPHMVDARSRAPFLLQEGTPEFAARCQKMPWTRYVRNTLIRLSRKELFFVAIR